jgi:glutamine---fructose-6-phosphate transaminase (isomerizing)
MSPHSRQLLNEIQEQPQCLKNLIEGFPQNFEGISLPGSYTDKLIGIGEGSSYNAIKIAAPFIEEFTGLNTFTFDPESLENKFEIARTVKRPIKRLFEHSYFLTVSQSGETASILNIMGLLQESFGFSDHYLPMLAFTNNHDGTLGSRYGNHFELSAGKETSIAATKSMTASIMALLLFGLHYGHKCAWLKRTVLQQTLATLGEIPQALDRFLQDEGQHSRIQVFSEALCDTNQFVLLSKGILASILPEAGLKLTETSRNIVWTDNTESFKHGRKVILHGIKGVRPNCVYLIPPNLSNTAANRIFHDIYTHFYTDNEKVFSTEGVFFTVFENSPPIPAELKEALNLTGSEVLTLPASHGIESLFLSIVAFQLLSYYLALAKGEDPNNPALQKAVTR